VIDLGSSAGPILINMIHEIDALQYLLGAISQVKSERARPRLGYEAEESGVLIMRFEIGIFGSFAFCDNVPSPYNFESGVGVDLFTHTGMNFYRIFGSKGLTESNRYETLVL
jgi:predicted dehydrogenase